MVRWLGGVVVHWFHEEPNTEIMGGLSRCTPHNQCEEEREKENRKAGKTPRYLTKKEQAQSRKNSRHGQVLQLEIESFYVFAKIYLDKTVHFLEVYFGDQRDCSFESFSGLRKLLGTLENAHGFKVQPELRQAVVKLEKEIVEFRDKKIIHAKMSRVLHGLCWNKEGRVQISTGYSFPKGTDQFFRSTDVRELWKLLEEYTEFWIHFVKLNRQKMKLCLKDTT
jgi:hypothetical protein